VSKTITIELDDEVYQALHDMSNRSGRPIEALALEWITKHGPTPAPQRSEAERLAARTRFLRFAGSHHGLDPHGSNNERIDADLAKEYHDPHERGSSGT
jgi:hypothetical protein